ncbi:hypothetical protein GC175_21265 [bacterium]|nr:hypothetical protein [bacterium]
MADTTIPNRSPDKLIDLAVDEIARESAEHIAAELTSSPDLLPAETSTEDESVAYPPVDPMASLAALTDLRSILLGSDKERIDSLSAEVQTLSEQISDKEALAAAIAPVLGSAIRKQIADSREEVIEALYPIVGQLVMRAVTEAMRDLARSIDDRVRVTSAFDRIGNWFRSFVTGVPASDLVLRDALPFSVVEIYLIHRESGLLLWHLTRDNVSDTNADLIGAMLTAIREFAEQVLGTDRESQLHELQYGQRLILLEFASYVYVGVLVEGVPPVGFRSELRRRVTIFNQQARPHVRSYNGHAEPLTQSARLLFAPLLGTDEEGTDEEGTDELSSSRSSPKSAG